MADDQETKDLAIRYPNLRPIKPGEVRNKEGKNGYRWKRELQEFFDAPSGAPEKNGETLSRFKKVLTAMYVRALKGSDAAQKAIVEQMAGKAKESLDLSNDDGSLRARIIGVRFVSPGEVKSDAVDGDKSAE